MAMEKTVDLISARKRGTIFKTGKMCLLHHRDRSSPATGFVYIGLSGIKKNRQLLFSQLNCGYTWLLRKLVEAYYCNRFPVMPHFYDTEQSRHQQTSEYHASDSLGAAFIY